MFARRLDSPLDSVLRLTDAGGKQLAMNDDFDDKAAGLITHQADSRIQFKLPANGTYYPASGRHAGPGRPGVSATACASTIRSRISNCAWCPPASARAPAPPYRSPSTRCAGTALPAISRVQLKNAPPGFLLSGGVVPASQDNVRMTLTVAGKPLGQAAEALYGRRRHGQRARGAAGWPSPPRTDAGFRLPSPGALR